MDEVEEEVEPFIPLDLTSYQASVLYVAITRNIEQEYQTLKKYQNILKARLKGVKDNFTLESHEMKEQCEILMETMTTQQELLKEVGSIVKELDVTEPESKIIKPPNFKP